jgi:hypothetical protein
MKAAAITAVLPAAFAVACDGEYPQTAASEPSPADPWLVTSEPSTSEPSPADPWLVTRELSSADPWLADLAAAELEELDTGVALVGYDTDGSEIGRVSLFIADDVVHVEHMYLRECWPGEETGTPCTDSLLITIVADDASFTTSGSATAALFDLRARAMSTLLESSNGWDIPCGITMSITAGACLGALLSGGVAIAGCAGAGYKAVCTCRKTRKAFPVLDEVCPSGASR